MSDQVVNSSVIVKLILPEGDSDRAQRVETDVRGRGGRLVILDLALIEVTNAIWTRYHRGLLSLAEVRLHFGRLMAIPAHIERAVPHLMVAIEIAVRYERSVYDSLFIALRQQMGLPGVTADEPLHRTVHADFPQILLLRDWSTAPA